MTTSITPQPTSTGPRRPLRHRVAARQGTARHARDGRVLAPSVAVLTLSVAGLAACASDGEQPQAATVPATTDLPRFGAGLGVQKATYEYTIPDGAGAALAAGGRRANILPGSLNATVGQSIRIENQDRQGHSVGPWYVGPNETLIQEFTAPGVFAGECTVHDSGRFILEVVEG